MSETIWQTIQNEITQGFELRKPLITKISEHFENRYVISFYTRFRSDYFINDADFEMLRTLLDSSTTIQNRKILFLINSPGGDPLAAEKIIKLLLEYSENDYWILIPGTAKSAATMICFGSSKIIMSPVSELGPIDLQVSRGENLPSIPAYSIISAYDRLLEKGINLSENQRIEPILQQLQNFDPAEIETFRRVNQLSADMAVKVLKNKMMKGRAEAKIKKVINIFLDPEKSKTHGRPIYGSDIARVDKEKYFNIKCFRTSDPIWKVITEYHLRIINHLRVNSAYKLIESEENSLVAGE